MAKKGSTRNNKICQSYGIVVSDIQEKALGSSDDYILVEAEEVKPVYRGDALGRMSEAEKIRRAGIFWTLLENRVGRPIKKNRKEHLQP